MLKSLVPTLSITTTDAVQRLVSSRCKVFLLLGFFALYASNVFATDLSSFGENFDDASTTALDGFTCAIRGTLGWFLIGAGLLLMLWDYFIQKQGHFLILGMVGVVAVFILGQALPLSDSGSCD
jgi:hypothetical protein